jgi:hypothetical protein
MSRVHIDMGPSWNSRSEVELVLDTDQYSYDANHLGAAQPLVAIAFDGVTPIGPGKCTCHDE